MILQAVRRVCGKVSIARSKHKYRHSEAWVMYLWPADLALGHWGSQSEGFKLSECVIENAQICLFS